MRSPQLFLGKREISASVDGVHPSPHRPNGAGGLPTVAHTGKEDYQPFPEIEVLYNLWRSSGKSVNLWDWLDGFQREMDGEGGSFEKSMPAVDEAASHWHATFIRFVEESRLLGTIRSRGKGTQNRGDEVAKGVVIL